MTIESTYDRILQLFRDNPKRIYSEVGICNATNASSLDVVAALKILQDNSLIKRIEDYSIYFFKLKENDVSEEPKSFDDQTEEFTKFWDTLSIFSIESVQHEVIKQTIIDQDFSVIKSVLVSNPLFKDLANPDAIIQNDDCGFVIKPETKHIFADVVILMKSTVIEEQHGPFCRQAYLMSFRFEYDVHVHDSHLEVSLMFIEANEEEQFILDTLDTKVEEAKPDVKPVTFYNELDDDDA